MTRILIVCALALLAGCATVDKALDRVAGPMVEQMTDYCAVEYHRRLAYYIFVSGELEPHGIELAIICPGDPENENSE